VVMSMHHIHMLIPDKFVYLLVFFSYDDHSDPRSQPMMPGMPPPGPPGAYMPGPYMQAMHYPPGMPPPNGQREFSFYTSVDFQLSNQSFIAMFSPNMGQMPRK
jgi:hypothetical protein